MSVDVHQSTSEALLIVPEGTISASSTALNQSRLQVLRAREEHLQSIFEEATKKTKDLKNDQGKYTKVLEDLILEVGVAGRHDETAEIYWLTHKTRPYPQVLLMLMAPEVTIDHQKAAGDFINSAGDAALKRYKEISGRDCKLDFQTEVSDESSGGIIGSVMNRRIKVDNTLDERLKILEEKVSLHAINYAMVPRLKLIEPGLALDRCCQRSGPTFSARTPTGDSTT